MDLAQQPAGGGGGGDAEERPEGQGREEEAADEEQVDVDIDYCHGFISSYSAEVEAIYSGLHDYEAQLEAECSESGDFSSSFRKLCAAFDNYRATFEGRTRSMTKKLLKRILQLKGEREDWFGIIHELEEEMEKKSVAIEQLEDMLVKGNISVAADPARNGDESKPASVVDAMESTDEMLQEAKQSQGKILELLVSQTKLLAETKESVEEAKLEIRSLQESIKRLERPKPSSLGSS